VRLARLGLQKAAPAFSKQTDVNGSSPEKLALFQVRSYDPLCSEAQSSPWESALLLAAFPRHAETEPMDIRVVGCQLLCRALGHDPLADFS
jgi:hypothetical protein